MKNRQGLTIAALIVAIVGLSIGFAAFSNTLTISSTASVNPDASNLKVVFANNTDVNNLNTNPVQVFSASTGASGTPGTINNEAQNGPALTGLKASFTAPNQSVVYKLNVVNAGKLKAYLTDIVFGTTGNPAKTVSCTVATKDSNNQDIPAEQQATDTLVQSACNGISISVKIGELDAKTASGSLNNLELNVAGYKEVIITISYASGSAYVDGPMNVAFGDIEINAASVGAQSQGGGEQPTPATSDFVSSEQGVLTGYNGSSTNIVIPDGLRLPVTTTTISYDPQKCLANIANVFSLQELEMTAQEACDYISEDMPTTLQDAEGYEDVLVISSETSQQEYLITSIADSVFNNKQIASVSIGSGITTINSQAFSYSNISTLDLSGATSLTTIGANAFTGNDLVSVTIPSSVSTIVREAFSDNSLTTVTIGDSTNGSNLTSIGDNAFTGNNLTSVTIYANSSIVEVGTSAFGNYDISGSWHPVS